MEIIQGMITVIFEFICCKFFLEIFLQKKNNLNKWFERLMLPVLAFGFILIAFFTPNYALKSGLIVLIIIAIVKIYYNATLFQSIVLSAIYYGVLIGIDYLCMVVLKYLLPNRYIFVTYDNEISATIVILLCKTVLFLVVLVIRRRWSKENDLALISNIEWIYFLYFPLFTIISMLVMVFDFTFTEDNLNALLFIAFGLVIMNFMVFYLMHYIVKREREIQNSKLIQERTKNQMNIYRNMDNSFEQYKKKIHDYNNQLNCIQGMLANGKNIEVQEYIANLTGSLIKDLDTIFTNHAVVDTVINQKYRYAKSKGIMMILKVNDLSALTINEEDLVALLSNILDNAIEACEKVKSDKVIKFKMIAENEQILISTQNPLSGSIDITDNRVVTSKSNKEEHGIGLLNVSSIVDKYDGVYAIKSEKGWFHISIIIPYKSVSWLK